jgi:50S ribosomal subunit-associated GTPase HflX
MLIVLNKIDLLDDHGEQMVQDLRRRLAAPVVPISAETGANIHDVLLAQMLAISPSLTVPLGREVATCRRHVASRLIRQSALVCGLLGAGSGKKVSDGVN